MEANIRKFRSCIMGVATVMILVAHAFFYGDGFVSTGSSYLDKVMILGISGVDIFLFLSGYGLVNSFKNNNLRNFYKNRIIRLLPTLLIIYVMFILLNIRHLKILLFFEPFILLYYGGFWFIGFIIIAYTLFPVIINLFSKISVSTSLITIFFITFLLAISFVINGTAGYDNPLVCSIMRIPIFAIGVLFGIGKLQILNSVIFNFISFLVGTFCVTAFYIIPNYNIGTTYVCLLSFVFFTTPMICFWGRYGNVISKLGGAFFGERSLEIYLVQVMIMSRIMHAFNNMDISPVMNILISVIIVIMVSCVVKRVSGYTRRILVKIYE